MSIQDNEWKHHQDNFYNPRHSNYCHQFFNHVIVCEFCGGYHNIDQCDFYSYGYDLSNSTFSSASKPDWKIVIEKLANLMNLKL